MGFLLLSNVKLFPIFLVSFNSHSFQQNVDNFLVSNLQLPTKYAIFVFMRVEVNKLMTIKNYADKENVTTSYIYKLIKEGKMNSFVIDGIQFIQVDKFPAIPVIARLR